MAIRSVIAALVVAGATVCASAAGAATFVFTENGTEKGGSGANSAKAVVTTSFFNLNTPNAYELVKIDLYSLTPNPTDDGQEVSGFKLFFSQAPGSVTLTSATAPDGLFTSKDKPKSASIDPNNHTVDHWGVTTSGVPITLTALSGAKPHDLIIGKGPYTNFNPSITQHNSSVYYQGEFFLKIEAAKNNLIQNEELRKVQFGYGTTGVDYNQGTEATPEPATWTMMILGVGLTGVMLRRRTALQRA